eukprot:8191627-Alexandrium_andersonii.AAC.1
MVSSPGHGSCRPGSLSQASGRASKAENGPKRSKSHARGPPFQMKGQRQRATHAAFFRPRWEEGQGRVRGKRGNVGVPGASTTTRGEDTGGKCLAPGLPLGGRLAPRGRHHAPVLRRAPTTRG